MRHFLLVAVFFLTALPLSAQTSSAPLRLFLDCQNTRCDFDYLRTELNWVSYVRNREDADVHALVTGERNSGGGRTYFVRFEGRRAFDGVDDELTRATDQNATDDEQREALASVLAAGLVRYLVRTDQAPRVTIDLQARSADAPPAEEVTDPWNFWIFRIGGRARVNGDANYLQRNTNLNLNANRTTETLKSELYFNASDDLSRFTFDDDVRRNQNNSYNGGGEIVFSLGPHWSAGGSARAFHSTFSNTDLSVRVGPEVEYSVFPYAQDTQRAFRFSYSIGVERIAYRDTTLFDQADEVLFDHELRARIGYQQPWGSFSVRGSIDQYLHDFELYSFDVGANADIRLFRGLTFNLGANYSRIRNQLNLVRGSASEEDVLTRRRQLSTGYDFFFSTGLTYTFGSAFNSVVNPRF